VFQLSFLKSTTLTVLLLGACFVVGWLLGQGALLASVERAYVAMFESMAPERNRSGEYYVVFTSFENLAQEVAEKLSSDNVAVEPTDVPNTAKIVFGDAAAASFDKIEGLEAVRFVMGSVLPFMCH